MKRQKNQAEDPSRPSRSAQPQPRQPGQRFQRVAPGGFGQRLRGHAAQPGNDGGYARQLCGRVAALRLAAGGPILQNSLRAVTLVPVCPQSMTNRPIVISDTCEIKILITKSGDARVHYDGQSFVDIQSMDMITIHRYRHNLRVLQPTGYQYYKTLRQKLHWGEQLV